MDGNTKRVIFCADDFGMSNAIDTGIIRLAAQGRLSAASCLTEGPTLSDNASALVQTGIQLGLHLNFTETLLPESAPSISAKAQELYLPLPALIRNAYLRRLDHGIVDEQIRRQLDRFEAVFGRAPDFVDGHQHIHQLPVIRDALLGILKQRYEPGGLPWLRNTRSTKLSGQAARYQLKAAIIQRLGSSTLMRRAEREGFRHNTRFAGVYDFQGGVAAYRALLAAWLHHLSDQDLLMCHPAAFVDPADPMGAQRHAEFSVLSEPETEHRLHEYKIHLMLDAAELGET